MKGTPFLRIGIAAALGASAVQWFTAAPSDLAVMSSVPTTVLGIGSAVLAVVVLLGILSRIAATVSAAYFALLAVSSGFTAAAGLLVGLALSSLSLAFIHEEHIPWRQRKILGKLFGRH